MLKDNKLKRWWQRKKQVKMLEDQTSRSETQKFSDELQRLAWKKLFRQPQFSKPDELNEYAEDYTFFTPRGDLITREMQRALQQFNDKPDDNPPNAESSQSEPDQDNPEKS